MPEPPWGHKPPAVDDHYRYWVEPPPTLSPRVEYWLRRLSDGTWKPNRRFQMQGYDGRTSWLGVYMWEYFNIILPLLREYEERSS
jgi:hypothetical protein